MKKAILIFRDLRMSLMKIKKNWDEIQEPCGIPVQIFLTLEVMFPIWKLKDLLSKNGDVELRKNSCLN